MRKSYLLLILYILTSGLTGVVSGSGYLFSNNQETSFTTNQEILGTLFSTSENSHLIKIRFLCNSADGSDHSVRIWEKNGNNFKLIHGPYLWALPAGSSGWQEFEFPDPVPVFKEITYFISIGNVPTLTDESEKPVNETNISERTSSLGIYAQNGGATIPTSWFISNSQRVAVILSVKFKACKIGSDQEICYNTRPQSLVQTAPPLGGTGLYTYKWQFSSDSLNWNDISNARYSDYTPPSLIKNTWYRCVVTSGAFGSLNSNPVLITVLTQLQPGTIGKSQTICYNTSPSLVSDKSDPSGAKGIYYYLWQSSTDNINWTTIDGATDKFYQPGNLLATTWFRRLVLSGDCEAKSSNIIQVTVKPALDPGTIGSDQSICFNAVPAALTNNSSPTGGIGVYVLQWQSSIDNTSWINIPGATRLTYSPPALSSNTWFRRQVVNDTCNIKSSNAVLISVNAQFNAGTIGQAQTICYNTKPSDLTLITAPSGGTGSYSYQWQTSSNGTTWTNIQNAVNSSYSPPALTAATWYRCNVTSGGCGTVSSNSVKIEIMTPVTAGSIGSSQSICYNEIPGTLVQINVPGGGSGTYTYQWQSSPDNNTWTDIPGASLSSYTPAALTTNMWYRRNVKSGNCAMESSNVVAIAVNPTLMPGTIGSDQTICYNTAPQTLTQLTNPAGGTGSYSYQWQRSQDNANWTNIPGATLATYSPSLLTESTWFRRNIKSGDCNIVNSNSVYVKVNSVLNAGTVGPEQSICYNTAPSELVQTAPPSGGTGVYTYQWQSSSNNTTWSGISGATSPTYSPGALTSTMWYRRNTTSEECGTASSQSVRITVYSVLTSGTVGSDQSICYNEIPATLSQITAPTGGPGTYTYVWQSSPNNSTWNDIAGASSVSYSPPALTTDTWFRRIVTGGSCGSMSSNTIHITINPTLTSGSIGSSQTICYNTMPAGLTQLSAPTGGTGTYTFQWQSSLDNSNWTNISGATSLTYTPPVLSSSSWFRRNVRSGDCATASSVSVLITVNPVLTAGSIGSDQNICYNSVPSSLVQLTAPSGGKGTYTFQWQSSGDNISWLNISGANQAGYQPPSLTSTTWYRRNVTSGECGTVNSSSVRITVYPVVSAGTIGSSQSICFNDTPAALTQITVPTGGPGTYTYQWQSSADNVSWNNIPGANSTSYSPSSLIVSIYYRQLVTGGSCGTNASNSILITVNPPLTAGTIGSNQTICYNTAPDGLVQLSPPTGGTGSYSYQWQRSLDNSTWTNISGANSASFQPGSLTSDSWFRRNVTSGECSAVTSNTVLINVLSHISLSQLHDSRRILTGTSTEFYISVTGGVAPYAIQYTRNGVQQAPLNNYTSGSTLSTGVLTTGTYTYTLLSLSDANGCNSQNLGTSITITVLSDLTVVMNSALVVVNSSSSYYSNYSTYIKPYLDNFGMPYDVCDVNSSSLPALDGYAVIIFGHRNVYSSGYPLTQLETAVNSGVGLYSFDPHLFDYSSNFNSLITQKSVTSGQITISDYTHYITSQHAPDTYNSSNNVVSLLTSWTLTQKSNLIGGTDLATMSSGGQTVVLLQAATYGTGKIVKWSGYDWVFESTLGPVYGMDDLIWRGIVWAARKPFIMQGIPPFITMRVDDADGSTRPSELIRNFTWINVSNEYGFIPWVGIFTTWINSSYISTIKGFADNNKATVSPHAFTESTYIYFNHNGLTSFDVVGNIRSAISFFSQNNIKLSKLIIPHWYEISSDAFAELHNQGIEYLGMNIPPDNFWKGDAYWVNCGPYRINRDGREYTTRPVYYGGYINFGGYDFFNCLTEIRDDGTYEWFPSSDITTSVARGIRHLRRSFNSMVLATLFTHEAYINQVSTSANWRSILGQVTSSVSEYNPEYVSLDYAVKYIRAKNNIRLTNVVDKVTSVEISYTGSNDLNTRCYLFNESNNLITHKFVTLPQINGSNTISVSN